MYCTFSRWLFGDKLLTTRPPCRIALFTALALGSRAVNAIRHGERVVTSTYFDVEISNQGVSSSIPKPTPTGLVRDSSSQSSLPMGFSTCIFR